MDGHVRLCTVVAEGTFVFGQLANLKQQVRTKHERAVFGHGNANSYVLVSQTDS
jgi:hypothetical protein